MTCDSGVARPANGRLTDGDFDYYQASCGFVVRYPCGGWFEVGQALMDEHNRAVHPERWAVIQETREKSKGR